MLQGTWTQDGRRALNYFSHHCRWSEKDGRWTSSNGPSYWTGRVYIIAETYVTGCYVTVINISPRTGVWKDYGKIIKQMVTEVILWRNTRICGLEFLQIYRDNFKPEWFSAPQVTSLFVWWGLKKVSGTLNLAKTGSCLQVSHGGHSAATLEVLSQPRSIFVMKGRVISLLQSGFGKSLVKRRGATQLATRRWRQSSDAHSWLGTSH